MEPNKNYAKIARYLQDTMVIKDAEFLANLPHSNKEKKFLITPWGVTQIIRNLDGGSTTELEDFLSRNDGIFMETSINNGERALRLQPHADPGDYHINGEHPIPVITEIHIKDAFGLLLYKKIESLSENGSKWVKKEDAIFGIKNSLMLPDDFIPQSWMAIVENDEPIESDRVIEDIQSVFGRKWIYVFSSYEDGKAIMPYFLYSRMEAGLPEVTEERLTSILTSEFEALRNSPEFRVFTLTRILKTVIFNLETKGTRELRKPLFDNVKMKLLMNENLVYENGGKFFIRESLSVTNLESLRNRYLDLSGKLSSEWMKRTVHL
ncbi:MAG: hypothetical protein ACYCT2_02435 [Thermoplasmataceae archaeon]